jgi:hypothetical protein
MDAASKVEQQEFVKCKDMYLGNNEQNESIEQSTPIQESTPLEQSIPIEQTCYST